MDSFARRIQGLADGAMKCAAIAHEIDERPVEFVHWLDEAAGSAELGHEKYKEALIWVANVLGEDPERTHALRVLADSRALLSAARILAKRPRRSGDSEAPASGVKSGPHRQVDDPRRAAALAGRAGEGRPLTLGERRALAVLPSRKDFEKVLRDPNPMVIDRLLKNSRLTEDDVLRMIVRRPGNPEMLREVAKNTKWSHRGRIRQALVLHPHTPPDVSMPLAPLLLSQEMKLVADTPGLPLQLRSLCTELIARREREEPENPTLH